MKNGADRQGSCGLKSRVVRYDMHTWSCAAPGASPASTNGIPTSSTSKKLEDCVKVVLTP